VHPEIDQVEPPPTLTDTETPPKKATKPREIHPKHFPRPPKFDCKPEQFFKYWRGLPRECLDRSAVYVYANYPVLDHSAMLTIEQKEQIRLKKMTKPKTNIAKPDAPFESDDWEMEILHRWGSGNYHFKLNDVGADGIPAKPICMCSVTRLDNPDYPPVRDIRLIDMSHPDNASYIAKMRLQGVQFPGDEVQQTVQQEEDDMANVAAVEKLADTVVQMARDNTRNNQQQPAAPAAPDVQGLAGAKAVESVAQGAKQGMDIIAEAVKTANSMQAKAQDPKEYLRDMREMVTMMQPPAVSNGNADLMLMMKMQHEQHMADVKSMREELAAERTRNAALMDKLISKPADSPSERPRSFLQELKALSEAKGTITELLGLNTEAADDTPWWGKLIERGLETLPDAANTFMHNLAVMRTGQGNAEAPAVEADAEQPAAAIQPPQPTGPDAIIINILGQLKDPLIQALANGTPGSDFAAAIINHFKNEQVYTFLTEKGKQGMFNLMQKHPDLWRETRAHAARLEVFADEFLDAERVKAALQMSQAAPTPKPNGAAAGRTIIDPATGQPVQHTGPRVNKPS
jgi:hypothetical protein